ncbi:MAG TPA: hypothetical protein ENJ52_04720 [Aliiroseovarius sp.]|nr:hypothetical protein [Aliiroseovarius sp.]
MRIRTLPAFMLLAATLAACSNWTDLERAGAGAAGGAALAAVTNGNVLAGAVIGGAAGALCDDLNVDACN